MNATAAVFRARLGAALRALPSDLRRDGGGGIHGRDRDVSKTDAGPTARGGIRSVAAALELASPGLALMMQLRARLFHDALRAAAPRGFRRAVLIGATFDRARMRRLRRVRLPLVIVDHPAVLAGAALRFAASGTVRLGLTAFSDVAWDELRAQARTSHDGPTLFLVEGVSMWGDAAALHGWLRAVAGGAPASEVLLNVLESAIVDRAHQVTNTDAQRFAAAAPAFGVGRALLLNEIVAAGLTPLRVFDSGEVQTAYLGIDDLLVRESYAWARVDAVAHTRRDRVDDTGALTVRDLIGAPPRRTPSPRPLLPRLRSGVELHEGPTGIRVVLPVTALRSCTRSFARRDSAMIRAFGGTCTFADLAASLTRDDAADADERLSRVAESLAAFGFLDDAAEPSSLDAACEKAFTAFIRADAVVAREAARSLLPFAANPAAVHLHARLRHVGRLLLERDGSIAVLAAQATASDREARTVAKTASGLLHAIARLIGVRFSGRVLIDVASSRPAVPVTMIAAAEPHTLVHIPWPSYSPSLLSHELAHVLAMCGSPWLSEGLAVWVQRLIAPGPCFPDDARAQDAGAPTDHPLERRLLGDERLAHDGGDGARRAYREAAAFVEWLVQRSGAAAFTRFFAAFGVHGDVDVDAACVAAGVPSVAALEREWRRSW